VVPPFHTVAEIAPVGSSPRPVPERRSTDACRDPSAPAASLAAEAHLDAAPRVPATDGEKVGRHPQARSVLRPAWSFPPQVRRSRASGPRGPRSLRLAHQTPAAAASPRRRRSQQASARHSSRAFHQAQLQRARSKVSQSVDENPSTTRASVPRSAIARALYIRKSMVLHRTRAKPSRTAVVTLPPPGPAIGGGALRDHYSSLAFSSEISSSHLGELLGEAGSVSTARFSLARGRGRRSNSCLAAVEPLAGQGRARRDLLLV